MTLPNQPSSDEAILDSQELFRIRQPVESAGSIYEIDTPTRAVYIGPNSDLSEVRLQYMDKQAGATQIQEADVSVGGPFVGRLDALMATKFPTTGLFGRILAYPVDIVEPDYERPTGALATPARRFNVVPQIDLICAVKALPEVPNVRADRTLRFPRVPFNNAAGGADDGSTDIVIPIYGRRMVTVQMVTYVLTAHITTFYLVALQPGTPSAFAKEIGSISKPSVSVTDTDSVVFRASDQYNVNDIQATGTTADPAMPTFDSITTIGPLGKCKGMADLLVINIKPDFIGPPPPGYSLVDVFVKLSDREV